LYCFNVDEWNFLHFLKIEMILYVSYILYKPQKIIILFFHTRMYSLILLHDLQKCLNYCPRSEHWASLFYSGSTYYGSRNSFNLVYTCKQYLISESFSLYRLSEFIGIYTGKSRNINTFILVCKKHQYPLLGQYFTYLFIILFIKLNRRRIEKRGLYRYQK